jgi:hypothetical protein
METLSAPQRKIVSSAKAGLTPPEKRECAERKTTTAARAKRSINPLL